MNCFNHPERSAVGICKACNKGLCPECAADLGHGLACRGVHEQRAVEIEQLVTRNAQVVRTAGGAKYLAPVFLMFMGAVFSAYGAFFARGGTFTTVLGIGFLVYGAYALVVNRRAYGKPDSETKT